MILSGFTIDFYYYFSGDELKSLIEAVVSGSYVEALKSPICQEVLGCSKSEQRDVQLSITDYYTDLLTSYLENSDLKKQFIVLIIGICFLNLFIQNNYTGPLVGPSPNTLIPLPESLIPKVLTEGTNIKGSYEKACLELLSDTEGVYNLLNCPEYLVIGKVVLIDLKHLLKETLTADWWCIRCAIIYQKILDERSPKLYEILLQSLNSIENNDVLLSQTKYRDITALFHLESLHIHLYYYDVGKARSHFVSAASTLGMKMSITGALGKRTKWQKNYLPQLVLKVEYDEKTITNDEDKLTPSFLSADLPKDLTLNDDTRLNKINYINEDEDIIPDLKPIEQALVLADLILKRRSQARDIQLDEESKAYIWALLQYPKNWSIQMSSLFLRSKIESGDSRAMERSMNQFEELVNTVSREQPSRYERIKLMNVSLVGPHWELQQELARMFMRLGCVKTALEIFERLHLWEDVITCYNELQMRQRSAEIIRNLLEGGETPKLLCLLGDATDDVSCYHKAFELSNKKSSRAQRCLGNYYYVRKEYTKAIEFYQLSLDLNTLQFPVWQRLAYCALQTDNWELCAKAYRRCSVLEPDSFESWNNMSQAYLKLDQKTRAWKTLQEALRCKSDSWRLWDNFMLVSTSLGYMSHAIHAYNQILTLKEKHIDTEILGRIVKAVVANETDPDGKEIKSLYKACSQLLARLTREVPTNPELWFLYGDIIYNNPNPTQETFHITMQHYRKSLAAATQKPGWEKDIQVVVPTIYRALTLLSAAHKATDNVNAKTALADLSSVRLAIKNVVSSVKRGQTNIASGELVPEVKDPLDKLEHELQELNLQLEKLRT